MAAPKVFGTKWGSKVIDKPSPLLTPPAAVLPVAACRPIAGKFVTGSTACKPVPQYTGSDMLGIGVVHKSGLQPVFSQEQAEDLAKMRR